MTPLPPLKKEQLHALAEELVRVIRGHAPEWTAPSVHDPGIIVVSCFAWFADTLAKNQGWASDDAALSSRRRLGLIAYHVLSDGDPVVTVDGIPWQVIPSDTGAAAGEHVYVLEVDPDGTATLVFGDGRVGGRPPSDGSEVAVTYRSGAEPSGARVTATFRWPPQARAVGARKNGGLEILLPRCAF